MSTENYINLFYNPSLHCVVSEWITPPSSSEFRSGMNASIELMKNHKTGKLISETSNLGAMSQEDMEWSATEWVQNALKAGYSKFACIMPEDIFAIMSVEETMNKVDPNQMVNVKYFSNRSEAEAWISEN